MVTYNLNIPDGPNNPSNDQPKMKTNANAVDTILAVDHVSFNTAGGTPNAEGGTHKQVTFNGKNSALAQTDPQSVLYTGDGIASTVAQLFLRNQNATFQISAICAWAFCQGSDGQVVSSQSSNVATIVKNSIGNFSVTLTTNAVSSATFCVFISSSNSVTPLFTIGNYSITGMGTFDVLFRNTASLPSDPVNFSFQVLQI